MARHRVDRDAIRALPWEEPPAKTVYDWYTIADQLRADPMRWAKVFEQGGQSVSNAIKQGSVAALHPDLGFEVRTANNTRTPPRTCDLYLRFNPDRVRSGLRESIQSTRKEPT
jgi:hypothetical protein